MLHQMMTSLERIFTVEEVQAHCDIPCKIYDTSSALIACLSVIRMVDLLEEFADAEKTPGWYNKMNRFIAEKEREGELLKHEIRIIWGDYFKKPQMEKFPEINDLTHSIMLLASKCKQEIDRPAALQLLEKVNRFAEIFWETKGVKTKKAVCPYPPSLEVVYPDL